MTEFMVVQEATAAQLVVWCLSSASRADCACGGPLRCGSESRAPSWRRSLRRGSEVWRALATRIAKIKIPLHK